MNKKEQKQMEQKIRSVTETVELLKHQETNLLEVIRLHPEDHPEQKRWVHEVFIGADYIIRLEKSIELMKQALEEGRKRGGKKKD